MALLTFDTLTFREKGPVLQVTLLHLFTTEIPSAEISHISAFTIPDEHSLSFPNIEQEKAEIKFSFLLAKYLTQLKTKLTGNKATYIHRNSGIPLIGHVAFGIVYRNSSIIEIKTNNACNLDCVYCSISEGLSSTKNDFVIEKEYLLEELQKLIAFVAEPVEIHIGVQGEPFLYADMENLIADLQQLPLVHTISIDTNGTLLTTEKIDRLAKNSKLQLNLSLDAIDPEIAKNVAGVANYNVNHVKNIIAYACEKGIKVIVAPVLTAGFNEQEMEKIIQWIKSLPQQPMLGIQNFLRYKTGRNPAKEIPWEKFYTLLQSWEKKYELKLKLHKRDFDIRKTKELPKPFREGDIITATMKCIDRFPNSVIAVAGDRIISVPNCEFKNDKKIKVKIVRDKHNIFVGNVVKS